MQEFLVDINAFLRVSYLSMKDKARPDQLKIITAVCGTSRFESFDAYLWGARKGEHPVLETCGKSQTHYLFSSISIS